MLGRRQHDDIVGWLAEGGVFDQSGVRVLLFITTQPIVIPSFLVLELLNCFPVPNVVKSSYQLVEVSLNMLRGITDTARFYFLFLDEADSLLKIILINQISNVWGGSQEQ